MTKDVPPVSLSWRRAIAESRKLEWVPFRIDNAEIERQRVRFDAAQEFIRRGKPETARKVFWWPEDEDPPKEHWTRIPKSACGCRRGAYAPEGIIGLCSTCGGVTRATPSLIPVTRISRA